MILRDGSEKLRDLLRNKQYFAIRNRGIQAPVRALCVSQRKPVVSAVRDWCDTQVTESAVWSHALHVSRTQRC